MPVSTMATIFFVLPVVTCQASGASRSASTLPPDWPLLLRVYCVPKLGSLGRTAISARGESPRPPALRRLRSSSRSTCNHALNRLPCCRCLMEVDLTGAVEPGDRSTLRPGPAGVDVMRRENHQRLRLSELGGR